MKNNFEIKGDTTVIFLNRKDGNIIETFIDTSDLKKIQQFPNTWIAHWDKIDKNPIVMGSFQEMKVNLREFHCIDIC